MASLAVLTREGEPNDKDLDAIDPALEITRLLESLDDPDEYFASLNRVAWDTARFYASQLSYRMYQPSKAVVAALRGLAPPPEEQGDEVPVPPPRRRRVAPSEEEEEYEEKMDIDEPEEEERPSKRRRDGPSSGAGKRSRTGDDVTMSASRSTVYEMTPPVLVSILQRLPDDGTGWLQPELGGNDSPEAQKIRYGNLFAQNLCAAAMELAMLCSERRGLLAQERLAEFRSLLDDTLVLRNEEAQTLIVKLYFSILAEDSPTANKSFAVLGNPGTGKTSGFLRLARLYYSMGATAFPPNAEADLKTKSDFVASFEGQTNAVTLTTFYANVGRMIALDEAYQIDPSGGDAHNSKFNQEAVSSIIQVLGDPAGLFSLVLLGYEGPTRRLINSNPGWTRRIRDVFVLEPMTREELVDEFLIARNELSAMSHRGVELVIADIHRILETDAVYEALAAKWNHTAFVRFKRMIAEEKARARYSKVREKEDVGGRYRALWAQFVSLVTDGVYSWTFTPEEWEPPRAPAPRPSAGRGRRL